MAVKQGRTAATIAVRVGGVIEPVVDERVRQCSPARSAVSSSDLSGHALVRHIGRGSFGTLTVSDSFVALPAIMKRIGLS